MPKVSKAKKTDTAKVKGKPAKEKTLRKTQGGTAAAHGKFCPGCGYVANRCICESGEKHGKK